MTICEVFSKKWLVKRVDLIFLLAKSINYTLKDTNGHYGNMSKYWLNKIKERIKYDIINLMKYTMLNLRFLIY